MRARVIGAVLALSVAAGVGAQGIFVPGLTSFGAAAWRESVASVAALPACGDSESGRIRAVRPPDADAGIYQCISGAWESLAGEGGAGASTLDDLTDVSTAGAAAGEALVFGGANWAPSATAVILEGDARLDEQTASDVPFTPTTGADWADPDPAEVGGALDGLAERVTDDEAALSTHAGNADAHHAEDHAARHSLGGADPVTATNLASGCTDAQVLGGTAAGTGVECQTDGLGYATVADEASGLTQRGTLNFTGAGVSCADNAGASRTDCTIAGGGVGGSTGANDNRLLRSDGTGGSTLQSSALIVDDTGIIQVASGGPHHFQNSSGGFRFYVDDFGLRFGYSGVEVIRAGWPDFQMRSEMHLEWASGSSPTGSKDTGLKRGAAGRVDVTNGSTGAGSLSALMAQLVPQASAPACPSTNAGLYFDTSGALCICPPGGSWSMVWPAAPTTENCT